MKTNEENKYLIVGIPLYLLLNIIDIYSTKFLIGFGYQELNPIMINYVNNIMIMAAIKLIGIFILFIIGYIIYKVLPEIKPLKNIPIMANSILGFVVLNNLYLMYGV